MASLRKEVSGRFGKTDGISAFFKATLREKTSPSSNIPETLMQGISQINLQDLIEHKEAFNKLKEELIQLDVFTKYVELFGLPDTLLKKFDGQNGLLSSLSKDSLKDLKEVVDYFLFHGEKAHYGKYNSAIQSGWIHDFKSLFKVPHQFEGWNKMLSEMSFFIEGKHILLAAKEDWASPSKKPKQKI